MKACSKCKEVKPLEEFYVDSRHKDGRKGSCKKCYSAQAKAGLTANPERQVAKRARGRQWHAANPERTSTNGQRWRAANPEHNKKKNRRWELHTKYGITPEQFDDLLAAQNGECACCYTSEPGGQWDTFCIDHDHTTGKIRGLLCHRCNLAIGMLGDSLEGVERAMEYMRRAA